MNPSSSSCLLIVLVSSSLFLLSICSSFVFHLGIFYAFLSLLITLTVNCCLFFPTHICFVFLVSVLAFAAAEADRSHEILDNPIMMELGHSVKRG